jgi:hypothetical protein
VVPLESPEIGLPIKSASGICERISIKGAGRMRMLEKVAKKLDLRNDSSIKEDLAYWLSKTPKDRIAAIEFLRRQYHGSSARLQRSARVIQQTRS